MDTIEDPDDSRLDDYRALRDPASRVAYEHRAGCFVAEGVTAVRRLLMSGLAVRSVLVLAGKQDRIADLLSPGITCYSAQRSVMRGVAGFDVHRGVLACAVRPPGIPIEQLAASATTLAVLEGVNDHENLGAIARSARALGIDGLVLDPTTVDPWYRRAVRVSMGEMMFLPLARATTWPGDLAVLHAGGFTVAALTPRPDADLLSTFAARRPERVALLLGAEGPGLSDDALAAADVQVRIPIRDGTDSLNVGHAAAIAFDALGHVARPDRSR